MLKYLSVILVVACGGTGISATTTEATAELPPKPRCQAYQGMGDLEEVDMAGLCEIGLELVGPVEDCVEDGGQLLDCIGKVAASDSRFDGLTKTELRISYEAGSNRVRRSEIWFAELDWCRFDKGEEACQEAIHDEQVYVFEPSVAVAATGDIMPPRPACSAYRGVGELAEKDLVAFCELGVELVPVVDECVEAGRGHQDCLEWAATAPEEGGGGFPYVGVKGLALAYDIGDNFNRRTFVWNAAFDLCRMEEGEAACNAAIVDEAEYSYP